jgi:hypothetical protein
MTGENKLLVALAGFLAAFVVAWNMEEWVPEWIFRMVGV